MTKRSYEKTKYWVLRRFPEWTPEQVTLHIERLLSDEKNPYGDEK